MEKNIKDIIHHINHYAATGVIHDALIPHYDQHGKWRGAPFIWRCAKRVPHLDRIESSYLPPSRRTKRDRSGTILRTSFIWRGNESVCMNFSGISGSLIVEGNAVIHLACLRQVEGSVISTTNKRVYMPNLRTVGGHFEMMHSSEVTIPRLRWVGGRVKVLGYLPPSLETVGDSLGLYWAFKAESTRLRHVGGYLVLTKAEVVRFPALESIGGSFMLTLLAKIVDVPKLQSIGGDFFAAAASSIRTPALRRVGGNMDSTSAKGYYHSRIQVGGKWITCPGAVEEWERNEKARRALKGETIWL